MTPICRWRLPLVGWLVFQALMASRSLPADEPDSESERPRIQIALLLDTSNSMDGLIEQARTQLWGIVNEMVTLKREGIRPTLEVALYEYGNQGLTAESGFVRQVLSLTNDLDRVSEELFALRTGGGEEYCGQVIQVAARDLNWSSDSDDLKMMVIAGNEPFSQGSVDYRVACKDAVTKGVVVHTIHCGDGVPDDWREGALLADGNSISINQDQVHVRVEAPQDAELARLSAELNSTYIAFGSGGADGLRRQEYQDGNAQAASPEVASARIATKASPLYRNAAWDLVDAVAEAELDVDKLEEAELPPSMRGMSVEERKVFVGEQSRRRARIQRKIKQLHAAREDYVASETAPAMTQPSVTLDEAVRALVRDQAEAHGFEREDERP
ncbi:MAG TPA: vWA domain-containing protein, partial [Pirellulaceae bacterium]